MSSKFITNNISDKIHNYDVETIKNAFDRNIVRKNNINMPIHIFGTGSDGNSVFIKPLKLLIDLGFTKKRYYEYDSIFFDKLNYIVITHHHSDHLNPATLFYILDHYPHIKVIVSDFFWHYVTSSHYKPKKKNGTVAFPYKEKFEKHLNRFIGAKPTWLPISKTEEFLITPRSIKHGDIENIALQIYHQPTDLKLLYCTDVDNLKGETTFHNALGWQSKVQGLNQNVMYNVMFLEANYDENKIQEWEANMQVQIRNNTELSDEEKEKQLSNVWVRAQNNRRHISEHEAFHYVNQFLTNDGIFIPMHASSSFGTLFQ